MLEVERPAGLEELVLIRPEIHRDDRGEFIELYHREKLRRAGLDVDFVQDNYSLSRRGVLRGLHFQHPRPQGKLVYVTEGKAVDVAVDVRAGSPTFGRWHSEVLSAANRLQMFVPAGFAHGFLARTDRVRFQYKCTDFYAPSAEHTLAHDDPDVGIEWAEEDPILSEKDRSGRTLRELERAGVLPPYSETPSR